MAAGPFAPRLLVDPQAVNIIRELAGVYRPLGAPSPRLAAMLKAAQGSARVSALVFCRDPEHHAPDCECARL